MYREALIEAEKSIVALDLAGHATALAELLNPWQDLDPRKEYTAQETEDKVGATSGFIAGRPEELAKWLEETTPEEETGEEEEEQEEEEVPAPPKAPGPSTSTAPVFYGQALSVQRSFSSPRDKLKRFATVTTMELPFAGTVTLRVTARFDGRRRLVCSKSVERQSGTATVRCPLSAAARGRLAEGPLALRVATGYRPAAGPGGEVVTRSHRAAVLSRRVGAAPRTDL